MLSGPPPPGAQQRLGRGAAGDRVGGVATPDRGTHRGDPLGAAGDHQPDVRAAQVGQRHARDAPGQITLFHRVRAASCASMIGSRRNRVASFASLSTAGTCRFMQVADSFWATTVEQVSAASHASWVSPRSSSSTTAAFPDCRAGRLPRYNFRGLLDVHYTLRPACSLNPLKSSFAESFNPLAESFNPLPANCSDTTGWNDPCRAGISPAEKWRLSTAHPQPGANATAWNWTFGHGPVGSTSTTVSPCSSQHRCLLAAGRSRPSAGRSVGRVVEN